MVDNEKVFVEKTEFLNSAVMVEFNYTVYL